MRKIWIIAICLAIGYFKYLWGYSDMGYRWDSNPTYYFYNNFDVWIGKGVGEELKGAWEHAKKGADVWTDVSNCDFELKHGGKVWNWGGYRDGVNTVDAWILTAGGGAGTGKRSAIAVTWIWLSSTKILEVDTNFDYTRKWSIPPWYWPWHCPSDKYDVQNVAAHEFGHWGGLDDLYSSSDSEKTMYGYATEGETKKRDLHQDDIDGIRHNYPAPSPPPGGGGGGCMNPEIGLELSKKEALLLESLKEKLALSDSSIANLYLQFEGEIMALLRMNPKLREQTKGLIQHFGEDLDGFANGKKGRALDKADLLLLNSWLLEIAKYGSPVLQNEIIGVKKMVESAKTIDEMLLSEDINTPKEPEPTKPEAPITFQTRLISVHPDSNSYNFQFELAENLEVSIEIYNILGQKVKGLNPGSLGAGRYTVNWNSTNNQGQRVSKGLYFAHFKAGEITNTQRLLVK